MIKRVLLLMIFSAWVCEAEPPAPATPPALPVPTFPNVAYGTHVRQVLDVYQAKAGGGLTPVLFFIHGGGWIDGDKVTPDFLTKCLENGISVVSINYRLFGDAVAAKIEPPVKASLEDAARALQYVRSRAAEWGFDKKRIAGCGGSAGGCSALWLAFHPDMAEKAAVDSVARESTHLCSVLAFVPQTTLDPKLVREWIPNSEYGAHAFGLPTLAECLAQRERLLPWIEQYSPLSHVSADDPPVLLFYDNAPALGQPYKDPPHCANYGAGMAVKLKAAGVPHEINYNNDYAHMKYPDLFGFLLEHLKKPVK